MKRTHYRHDIDERINKARRHNTREGVAMLVILFMIMGGYFVALDSIF